MHRSLRRPMAALAVLALPLALATACGGSDDASGTSGSGGASGTTKVTVGVIPIVDIAPIHLGIEKGFFKEEGLELKLENAQGGAAITPAVMAGQYQFGFSNVTSLMLAESDGAPLRAVANGVASTGRPGRDFSAVVVRDGSPIHTAKDLAGKKIAVNTLKNIGDTSVRQSIRADGGDPAGVTFVAMPFAEMPAAVGSGTVDAAWVVEPQLSATLTQGGQVVASNYVDAAPDMTVAVYFTSNPTIDKDPQLVAKFTDAIKESLKYAATHPDEVRDIVGTYTQINDTVRIAMILPSWPDEINRASLERVAQLGRRDGIFKKPPSLDQLLPAS
jgi:NitT/TauT family transport system substrate-binding protein